MSKQLTNEQIKQAAKKHGIDYAALKAVIDVECKGSGFLHTGEPVILFERHWFWRLLGRKRWFTKRLKIMAKHPRVCNPKAGGYGKTSQQHGKLSIAASYNRDAALQSASWGLGQVMGFHWQDLGYPSLQAFINDMYESEAKQLEAMLRFINKNRLVRHLNNKHWARFARAYNGRGYKRNKYDTKLAMAHARYA